MTPDAPRVAVVVLNWNGLAHTRACLASLARQAWQHVEVHVVDNASANGEADALAAEFGGRVRLHRAERNLGFTGGCNLALRVVLAEGRCRYVALLNNDAEAEPEWVAALVASAEADPRIGLVASRMVFHADPTRIENAGVHVLSNGDNAPRGRHAPAERFAAPAELVAACGGALLARVATLQEVGLLREDFFANFEDVDLSLRTAVAGWRIVYAPAAIVRHHLNASIVKVRDLGFDVRSVRNATWAFFVNAPAPVIALNLPWFVLCNLAILAVMPLLGRTDVARAFWRGRLQAWRERDAIRAERARLRPLRRASWLGLWWRERSYLVEYLRILLLRLRGQRTRILARA